MDSTINDTNANACECGYLSVVYLSELWDLAGAELGREWYLE